MPTQTELLIHAPLPPGVHMWYPGDARRLLARLIDEASTRAGKRLVPPEIFHYGDDGFPLSGLPLVRFGMARNAIRITGIAEQGAAVVRDHARVLTRILSEHFGRPLREELRSSEVAITSGRWRRYRAYSLATTIRPDKYQHFAALDDARKKAFLADLIRRGINRQVEMLALPFSGELDITVHDVGRSVPVFLKDNTKSGGKIYYDTARYVDFSMPVKLEGHWAVGHHIARGHGQVRQAARDPAETQERIDLSLRRVANA